MPEQVKQVETVKPEETLGGHEANENEHQPEEEDVLLAAVEALADEPPPAPKQASTLESSELDSPLGGMRASVQSDGEFSTGSTTGGQLDEEESREEDYHAESMSFDELAADTREYGEIPDVLVAVAPD